MDKNYAYIMIVGDGDIEEITDALNLKPTKSWNLGDRRQGGSTYERSLWMYEAPNFEKEFLDEALSAVVQFIEEKEINLLNLPSGFEAYIQCVGYHKHQSPGFHLSGELVRKIARLGVAVDFDLYCHAEHHS